jgi:hypothetical protein
LHIPSPRSSRSHLEAFSSWRSALCPSHTSLRAYFTSGWAFFIPYLAAYLLYAWLKWPANSSAPSALGHGGYIPALLHVYWALHVINAILAVIALRSWWCEAKQRAISGRRSADSSDISANSAINRPPATGTAFSFQPSAFSAALRAVAPWLFLTLIFAIPGVYLEWPSDPWEHLRRMTEWATHVNVSQTPSGYKTFYFFAYSWVGWLSPAHLISWLNIYYTAVCLLLAWQYYLLAKAVGLDRRWAFLSVIINVLTFGNVCFSFYRYYALASTIFSQIGAIALTRIALEWAKGNRGRAKSEERRAKNGTVHLPLTALPAALRNAAPLWIGRFALCALLLALIAFNHVQGVGVAWLGIGSIIGWRLIEWKRSMIFWLCIAAIAMSVAAILWWPRNLLIDSVLRPQGWLNACYGYNLFTWPSPAADRMMQILGLFGLTNLVAGIILLRWNNVVGWLVAGPVIALVAPCFALPLAESLLSKGEIVTFHRMLFAVPSCLGLVVLAHRYVANAGDRSVISSSRRGYWHPLPTVVIIACVAWITLVPSSNPWSNRYWQILSVTPQDLRGNTIIANIKSVETRSGASSPSKLVATSTVAYIFNTISPLEFPYTERMIDWPMTESIESAIAALRSSHPTLDPDSTMNDDPAASTPSEWTTLAGSPPEFITNLSDFPACSTALQNRRGQSCEVFTSTLIPINAEHNYRAEWSIRQLSGTDGVAYLAIAWYDAESRLIESNKPPPSGAGFPAGWWSNGLYSYFGLVRTKVPTMWTTYRTSFGPDEKAAIPLAAKFVRIGAQLNYNESPVATIQLTDVRLSPKSDSDIAINGIFPSDETLVAVPVQGRSLSSYASQAGESSGHWPAQQVASSLAGATELVEAASKEGAKPLKDTVGIFELKR